jgi:uncharacterized protein YaiI (UPF0178 family)
MKILIDADASPVQKETIAVAKRFAIHVVIVKSYAHFSTEILPDYVEVFYVDSDKEAADLAIFQRATKNDIVITQDYGLASLLLRKGCHVIHHKGFLFTEKNIDRLLDSRHMSAKLRRAGFRTKGPSAYTKEEREKFIHILDKTIKAYKRKE